MRAGSATWLAVAISGASGSPVPQPLMHQCCKLCRPRQLLSSLLPRRRSSRGSPPGAPCKQAHCHLAAVPLPTLTGLCFSTVQECLPCPDALALCFLLQDCTVPDHPCVQAAAPAPVPAPALVPVPEPDSAPPPALPPAPTPATSSAPAAAPASASASAPATASATAPALACTCWAYCSSALLVSWCLMNAVRHQDVDRQALDALGAWGTDESTSPLDGTEQIQGQIVRQLGESQGQGPGHRQVSRIGIGAARDAMVHRRHRRY